jgi:glycosyltransferase involved in cell wall biosynthesis
MHIALLHRDLPPEAYAGVAVQAHRLAQALSGLGQQVSVISLSPKPPGAGYQVRPLRIRGLDFCRKRLPRLKRLWFPLACRFLDFDGYDVVHVLGDGGFLDYRPNFVRTFFGAAGLESKHSPRAKGRLAQYYSHLLERRESALCRHTAAIGTHVGEWLPGIRHIIPCMAANPPDASSLSQKSTNPSVLYVGAQGGRKRGEYALRLLDALLPEFPTLEFHYVGPESERSGLTGRTGLHFYARLPERELLDRYRRAWVYVCFSSYEGFGVPCAEALSLGCCVVSTPHAGAQEWLRNGENALLREPDDFSPAVSGLLRDRVARENLARRGLEAASGFAPDRVAGLYLDLYRRAAGQP